MLKYMKEFVACFVKFYHISDKWKLEEDKKHSPLDKIKMAFGQQ